MDCGTAVTGRSGCGDFRRALSAGLIIRADRASQWHPAWGAVGIPGVLYILRILIENRREVARGKRLWINARWLRPCRDGHNGLIDKLTVRKQEKVPRTGGLFVRHSLRCRDYLGCDWPVPLRGGGRLAEFLSQTERLGDFDQFVVGDEFQTLFEIEVVGNQANPSSEVELACW